MVPRVLPTAELCFARFALAGLVLLLLNPAPLAFAAETARPQHQLLELQGQVEVLRKGATAWTRASTNMLVLTGDSLRTGKDSRAAVRLSNDSVVRMDQLTVLLLPEPVSPRKRFLVNLLKGAIYFFHRERPVETDFETPLVSGAIRGTEFNLAVAENGTTVLTLLDGAVDLVNPQGTLALRTGDQARVEPGGAPRKTAVIEGANVIQWCLYYPAVLDSAELALSDAERQALAESLAAYGAGDLPQTLAAYPPNRQATSAMETVFLAQLELAAGQVAQARQLLERLPAGESEARPLADALLTLISAVTLTSTNALAAPQSQPAPSASKLLADSYQAQAASDLPAALRFARAAVVRSPEFGFGWARVAELEFSFGHTPLALQAINRALSLSPRNAQALAVKGFLFAGREQFTDAIRQFDQAIALDSALGNAWLGRGLCRIRLGQTGLGRDDLLVAAALEPNRALLRSYLGKAFYQAGETAKAVSELELAKRLDKSDPTAWLYSALLNQQRNRINQAIDDLEHSQELNENRQVYRSRFLLDQDRAVRGANLASVYSDAGLTDPAFREAARSANLDYANFSAHLFLANSYNELRDPKQINLRYETPWLSEFLVANLLAPVEAGTLSQPVSQQEYSRLFERNRLGLVSSTEYRSNGDWEQAAAQYGIYNRFAYAAEVFYRSLNGFRPNNDLDQGTVSFQMKYQLTAEDSVYLQPVYYWSEAGDLRQFYDQRAASADLRTKERQEPLLLAGWHHEWSPESHTLFLAGRLQDTFNFGGTNRLLNLRRDASGMVQVADQMFVPTDYRNELTLYTAEAQHILEQGQFKWIAGGRIQSGDFQTRNQMPGDGFFIPPTASTFNTDFRRAAVYGYGHWQPLEPLLLIGGVSYDWLDYPQNFRAPPVSGVQSHASRVSPKAGVVWSATRDTTVRAAYTRSLGGVSFDQSFQLEPSQIAGFQQVYRSLIPESVRGALSAERFESFGVALDQKFPTRTYLGLSAEWLRSHSIQSIGAYEFVFPNTATAGVTPEHLHFEEKSLRLTINQLLGQEWSLGAQYRLIHADLADNFTAIPANAGFNGFMPVQHPRSMLHQLNLLALYNHPCGFFAQAQGIFSAQSNWRFSPIEPGDAFWQANALLGYRLPGRRAELTVGVLNLTDRDYRLEPLTLYQELPRRRTAVVGLKFYF